MEFITKMNITTTGLKLLAVAGIATATLLDAAPSKAILYIDFIPLSPTQTRIQASGSLDSTLLGTSSSGAVSTAASGTTSSGINSSTDALRFTYSPSTVSNAGRRYSFTGTTNPFTIAGGNTNWSGTTPTNNPALLLRFTNQDLWLPNTYTSGDPINGFFDVNLSLAQISLSAKTILFTSGTEQIILRNNPPPAPGPVPLLGAAAAFGYSRKLRNRIQKSTPSPVA
jgi:hypothetical protein